MIAVKEQLVLRNFDRPGLALRLAVRADHA
jgi:hypothetical protein